MTIQFRCASCGKSLRAPDESAGKTSRCPNCKQPVLIVPPTDVDSQVLDFLMEEEAESAAAASIMVWRRKGWFEGEWDWGELAVTLLWILAVPMVLHGLYDTLLKKEMNALALVAALASFGWLVFIAEWTRYAE